MKPEKAAPPNYQQTIKAKEFLVFLRDHGVLVEETESLSRTDSSDDTKLVKSKLHCGVRLLISNSRKQTRIDAKEEFENLLITQAAFFQASKLDDVHKHGIKIANFLKKESRKTKGTPLEAENMEIDFYTHGWVNTLSPVKASTSITMGIEKAVVPMICGTPEPRPDVSQVKPQKATPLAKGDSNVINVGEIAGTSDEYLPKKIAQLEQALTYAMHRANNSNIEEVVGYGALCMSMVDGSSFASVIINLHPKVFPYLAKLQKKGGLAYLFSRRTIFGDIETMIEHYGRLEQRFERLEQGMQRMIEHCGRLEQGMERMHWRILVVGAIAVFALALHRKG